MASRPKYRYKREQGGRVYRDKRTGRFARHSTARRSNAAVRSRARQPAGRPTGAPPQPGRKRFTGAEIKRRLHDAIERGKVETEKKHAAALAVFIERTAAACDRLGIELPPSIANATMATLDFPRKYQVKILHEEWNPRKVWTESEEVTLTPRDQAHQIQESAREFELWDALPEQEKKKSPKKRLFDVEEVEEEEGGPAPDEGPAPGDDVSEYTDEVPF